MTQYIYAKNQNIKIQLTNINPGKTGLTIVTYEWKINGLQVTNNTSILNINTTNLLVGMNTITSRIQNSCGSWSIIKSIPIEVYKSTLKTVTININNPTTNITIQLT